MQHLTDSTFNAAELLDMNTRAAVPLIGPLRDPSITLIHAPSGIGKTFLVHEIAMAVCSGESQFQTNDPPRWKLGPGLKTVLIVDGEMTVRGLQERMGVLGQGRNLHRMHFISQAALWEQHHQLISIDTPKGRKLVEDQIEKVKPDLVIFDNLTTLTGDNFDENNSSSQRPINRWFSDLRERGIATILVHHDGKNGSQRGSSDRTSICDLIIHLTRQDITDDSGIGEAARFTVEFTKHRLLDRRPEPFTAHFFRGRWLFYSQERTRVEDLVEIMRLTGQWDWRAISQEMEISRSRVYKLRQSAKDMGLWDPIWDGRKKGGLAGMLEELG